MLAYALNAYGDVLATALDERTSDFRRDAIFAMRSVAKAPGFAVVVIGTLALAIGANTAVFSVLRAVVLAPLPYDNADRIVALRGLKDDRPFAFSLPDFADLHAGSKTLAAAAVSYGDQQVASVAGEPLSIALSTVTLGYFDVFAVAPQLGRFFSNADARAGAPKTIVIAERFWRTRLGAKPNIIGSTLAFDDAPYRVIGIAPARFSPPGIDITGADAWRVIPERDASKIYSRGAHYFSGIARLRPGASLEGTRAELDRLFAALRLRYPETDKHFGVGTTSLIDDVVGDVRPTLLAMLVAVGGVLAVACANVANLLLGRASVRERELVVRLALGASRRRVVAQLLTETFVFAVAGGTLGTGIAYVAVAAFLGSQPSGIPRVEDVRVEAVTLAYTLAVVAAVTFAAGLVPALSLSRRDLCAGLQTTGRSGDASRGARGRAALVVLEIACTLALVVVAGLTIRSYGALTSRPLGFEPRNVTALGPIRLSGIRYRSEAGQKDFYSRSLARLRSMPGVTGAAWGFSAPILANEWSQSFQIVGRPVAAGDAPAARMNPVGANYFDVLGVPLRLGRRFTDRDRHGAPEVAVVNEAFTRVYLRGKVALGTRLSFGSIDQRRRQTSSPTIVGVVPDARNTYAAEVPPTIYRPLAQSTMPVAVLLAKHVPGIDVNDAMVKAIANVDPRMVRPDVAPLDELVHGSAARARLTMQTLAGLAALALALALAGVFAVVSYGVSQRTHEFGIRMALGARPTAIRAAVVARAMRVAALGIALGVVLAAIATRSLTITLYDIAPLDPGTFAIVVTLVGSAALVAALIPAWRATRVDPVVALRYD